MSKPPPCGRSSCPVVVPSARLLRRVAVVTWAAGERLHRGHRLGNAPDALVPGIGDSRFAPLPDTHHTYVSRSRTAGLLESALHELSGRDPTIYLAQLDGWALTEVALTADVVLADLRDAALDRLGIARAALVDSDPLHHPCTRRWAAALRERGVARTPVAGVVWHSRQADLHARSHRDGLLGDLLAHRATEVAVLWQAPGAPSGLRAVADSEPLLHHGRPARLVVELSALTGAPLV